MSSPTGSSSVPEEPRDPHHAHGPSSPDDIGPVDGASLLAERALLDRGEAAWLALLARFDASGDWALDGMASCAVWLVTKAGMGRSTAHDKVRTARQLAHRPLVAAAFAEGRISYSAARTITRVTDLDPDTDQALITLAVAGTVADLERTVRHIELLADQDRPPADDRTGLRAQRIKGGMSRLIIDAPDIDIDEVLTTIDIALTARNHRDDQAASRSSAEDIIACGDTSDGSDRSDESDTPDDESSAEDICRHRWGPAARLDVFLDFIRLAATANPDTTTSGGGDRYLTHIHRPTRRHHHPRRRHPLSKATAEMIACDTSTVAHLIGPDGEPLALGRRQRTWSTAQRRAARIRDAATCRWPACANRIVDLHHHRPWEHGGTTDIANGYLICRHHHTLIHTHDYQVTGQPSHTLTFHRPDGQLIGHSTPPGRLHYPGAA